MCRCMWIMAQRPCSHDTMKTFHQFQAKMDKPEVFYQITVALEIQPFVYLNQRVVDVWVQGSPQVSAPSICSALGKE